MSKNFYIILFALLGLSFAWGDTEPYPAETDNPCFMSNPSKENEATCKSKGGECCFIGGIYLTNQSFEYDCYYNKKEENASDIAKFWDEEKSKTSGGYKTISVSCSNYKASPLFELAYSWDDKSNPYPIDDNPCGKEDDEIDEKTCKNKNVVAGECCFLEGRWTNGTADTDCFWNKYQSSYLQIKNFWDDEQYETTKVKCPKSIYGWDDVSNPYPKEIKDNPCAEFEGKQDQCVAKTGIQGECCYLPGKFANGTDDSDCFWNKYLNSFTQIKDFWDDKDWTTDIDKITCSYTQKSDPGSNEAIFANTQWDDNSYPAEDNKTNPCLKYENDPNSCKSQQLQVGECCALTGIFEGTEGASDCFYNKFSQKPIQIKAFWDDDDWETTKVECPNAGTKDFASGSSGQTSFTSWNDEINPYPKTKEEGNPCAEFEYDEDKCLEKNECAFIEVISRDNGKESTDCFYNKYDNTANEIKGFWDDSEWETSSIKIGSKENKFPTEADDSDDDRLKGGAVAGIAIATFIVGLAIGIIAIYCACVKKAASQGGDNQVMTTEK